MARTGITFDEVKEVAANLVNNGENPSIQRVRERLGTGSNTTIAEHLKRWRRELQEKPHVALPSPVPETVAAQVKQVWNTALEAAEADYQASKEEMNRALTEAGRTRDEALRMQQQLAQEKEALEHRLAARETTIQELHQRLLVEAERRQAAESQIAAAERRAANAAKMTEQHRTETAEQIRTLQEVIKRTRVDGQRQLREAEQRLQAERERGEAGESRLMQIIDQLRTEQTKALRFYEKERGDWTQETSRLQHKIGKLEKDLADTRSAEAGLQERSRQLAATLQDTQAALHAQEDRHLAAVRLGESLRGRLRAAASRQQVLKQQLDACQKALQLQQVQPSPAPPDD